jgi:dipeptidyl aminopeptidase/acylaminoacyl peptidase
MRAIMSTAVSRTLVSISFAIVCGASLLGQQPALTADDYARAERFLAPAVTPLVVGGTVTATWLPDDRFWYRNAIAGGAEFILVDPAKKTRARAFNHEKIAAALSAAGTKVEPLNLEIQALVPSADGTSIAFNRGGRRWSCDVEGAKCLDTGAATAAGGDAPDAAAGGRGGRGGGRGGAGGRMSSDGKPLNMSPDGKRGIFIRDWNLWVYDVATRQERQLTTDGAKYFGYATDNAGWASSDRAIALWSPDSKKIATQQQDEREVGELYFVPTVPGHPTLRVSKYPLPGDKVMAMLHRVVIDVDAAKTVRLQMEPDFHRGTISDNISVRDYNWSPDGSKLALASVSRDHKQVWLRVADTVTGAVRTVLEEKVATHYESRTPWDVLWPSNEVVWYSERNDWGNLYLYDLNTGALKHPITTGEGPVTQVERIDEKTRTLWYGANGREKGRDPYFTSYYRISLDASAGARAVAVTPDDAMHSVQVAPSGRYVIDTASKPDVPPAVTLRDADGRLVMPLERADISKLTATGWKPPTPIKMKAADGKTDIYGLMFTPSKLDPSRKYPIINQVYPGPQSGSTGSRAFTAARGDRQALAELGFVVVTIDGRGTPGRSKSFMDAYYGAMGRDNTIPDQVAGMKDLAKQFPYIDLDRVGIWGHSGGGFATTSAMFRYPDFFKVGIAESGNHDQRNYEDDWGERYQGLLVKNADGTDNYQIEANQTFAKDLKGKLMLAHGTMDTNVPPSQTLLVVDALIKANKDFDLVLLPNQAHGYADAGPYMMRRRWDYFVKWLTGVEPPREYKMRP